MEKVLVANVYFEEELQGKPLRLHPLLQYLPLLYAESGDKVLVDSPAPGEESKCVFSLEGHLVEPWGFSESFVSYVRDRGGKTREINLAAVELVASKLFCFDRGFHLKRARLISNEAELLSWAKDFKGPKILRRLLGMTGRGHYFFTDNPDFHDFPAIGEPFVQRDLDFSTQWFLSDEESRFLGATHLINNPRGSYQATRVGDEQELFGSYYGRLQEAISAQKVVLEEARKIGFRGYCGVDSMIYDGGLLQPMLEINARRTMGLVALKVASKRGHEGEIFFAGQPQENAEALLPVIKKNQKQLYFRSF